MKKNKIDIKSMPLEELKGWIEKLGQPSFRAIQIFQWLHQYQKQVTIFEEMTNLPKSLIDILTEKCDICVLKAQKKQISKMDGSIKYLFLLSDQCCVETVVMKYEHGYSVCISTQVGCKMGCSFCASTRAGFVRNLTPAEMLEQIYQAQQQLEGRISHVVLMGIGEPLDNYDHVISFLKLINDSQGLSISMRHITLSTCGLVDKIEQLARLKLGITLAVSLHAVEDHGREQLMPINKQWNIEKLLQSCRTYSKITGRRVSVEYALIQHVNDSLEQARQLARLLKGLHCHVNLISVNPVAGVNFQRAQSKQVYLFAQQLQQMGGINVTIRRILGDDISAACGQLRLNPL